MTVYFSHRCWGEIMTETQLLNMLFMECQQDIFDSYHKLSRVGCAWEQRCSEYNKNEVNMKFTWLSITLCCNAYFVYALWYLLQYVKYYSLKCKINLLFNPFEIRMHFLGTALYTFSNVLTSRVWLMLL